MQAGVPTAPFGGVGELCYGSYHGPHGLCTFSHSRIVVSSPARLDVLLAFRYPPSDAKYVPKVAVKNTLGLKRGERLQDQKLKGRTGKVGLLLRVLVVGAALVVLDKQVGGRLLGVLDVVGKCDAGVDEVGVSVRYEGVAKQICLF